MRDHQHLWLRLSCYLWLLLCLWSVSPADGQAATTTSKAEEQKGTATSPASRSPKPSSVTDVTDVTDGDIAMPLPPGASVDTNRPEEPQPRHILKGELIGLDALLARLERKDKRLEQALIGPTILFGSGCATSLAGIVMMSLFPSMAAAGLIFAAPLTWLVIGAILAVVGFGLVVAAGVWHRPIQRKRNPITQDLLELRYRRKQLVRELQRAESTLSPSASHIHLPHVAMAQVHIPW